MLYREFDQKETTLINPLFKYALIMACLRSIMMVSLRAYDFTGGAQFFYSSWNLAFTFDTPWQGPLPLGGIIGIALSVLIPTWWVNVLLMKVMKWEWARPWRRSPLFSSIAKLKPLARTSS